MGRIKRVIRGLEDKLIDLPISVPLPPKLRRRRQIIHLARFLVEKGFSSGNLNFWSLGLEVKLAPYQFYKEVEAPSKQYCDTLLKEFPAFLKELKMGLKSEPLPEGYFGDNYGVMFPIKIATNKGAIEVYSAVYEPGLKQEEKIATVSHERGHIIWQLGLQDKIYSKFTEPELVKSKVPSEEHFASLCGWVGLINLGYIPEKVTLEAVDQEADKRENEMRELVVKYFKR